MPTNLSSFHIGKMMAKTKNRTTAARPVTNTGSTWIDNSFALREDSVA